MANIIVAIFSEAKAPWRCCPVFHTGNIDHPSVNHGVAAASPIAKKPPGTAARRDEKTDLGSGEREEWLTPSAEQRPDLNGGRGRARSYGHGAGRTAGINLEPTNHCSRNSETVN
ncbi:hypothetical protein V500_05806 [Pseudogymnoascus sp. VKM F-4518 (FW-2643)]|nr:hypothetical protein V500_05806 [Pseudogymnoascus sp. VKM F-4518 (FW-2643)]